MKKYTFFTFLLLSVLTISCSEEDSTPIETVDDTDYFNYTANGTAVPIESWTAIRSEDNFEVLGIAADGRSLSFDFDVRGNLSGASSTPADLSSDPWLNSFYEFTSHYFDFTIVAIDEANKIIKVNYSGDLYEEEYDPNSPSTPVEGTFNVHYVEMAPSIPGLGFSADIAGDEWHSVKSSTTISGADDMTLDFNSDDAYKLSLNFSHDALTPGTYNFSEASTPKVTLSKYDPATYTYTDYICSGTLIITEKTTLSSMTMVSGSFSFTAINPISSSEIEVTNGSFKALYSN